MNYSLDRDGIAEWCNNWPDDQERVMRLMLATEELRSLVKGVGIKWREPESEDEVYLMRYLYKFMGYDYPKGGSSRYYGDETKCQLTFIEKCIPLEALAFRHYEKGINRFIRRKWSFWSSLKKELSEEEWREIWTTEAGFEKLDYLTDIGEFGIHNTPPLQLDPSRKSDPPVYPRKGKYSKEVRDVLRASEIMKVVRLCVNSITVSNNTEDLVDCVWSSPDIGIKVNKGNKEETIPSILHETGHAFGDKVYANPKGESFLADYAGSAAIMPSEYSSYSSAFCYLKRLPEQKKRLRYVQECFAEDFRLYLLRPDALNEKKRELFDGMWKLILPKVKQERIRGKIRSTLGNFYGKSVDGVLEETDENEAKRIAEFLDRRRSDKQSTDS